MTMNVEARIIAFEEHVVFIEHKVKELEPKVDQVLDAVVDVHRDLNEMRRETKQRFDQMPDVIARAVAPLIRGIDPLPHIKERLSVVSESITR